MTQRCATCFRDAEGLLIYVNHAHQALLGDGHGIPTCLHCADEAFQRPLPPNQELTLWHFPDTHEG
jgi:hypothetical protein